jgi:hypothetical protein
MRSESGSSSSTVARTTTAYTRRPVDFGPARSTRGREAQWSASPDDHETAAKADILRRLGRPAEAAAAYERALGLVTHAAERRYLERRLREVRAAI